MEHESISTVLHNTRTKRALLYFLLQKHHFFKSPLQYLQLITAILNMLERCKCVTEQLELRVTPDE